MKFPSRALALRRAVAATLLFAAAIIFALAGIATTARAQVPPSVPASSSASDTTAPVFRPQNTGYGLQAGQDFTTGSGGNIALGAFPTLVAEITYLTWTGDGLLRHTVFVGLRSDKPAIEVRRE
jgi:hypothetical protein